jgi:hypothetical protein
MQKFIKIMALVGPPKLHLNVLFYCFDFKKSNSALPNSTLYTLDYFFIIEFQL